MVLNLRTLLLAAAVILFVIAFLIAVWSIGSHWNAWVSAGLACLAASFLSVRTTP